uniref:E3 ubiquitin-protein ligase n=1 Tax=Marseillevirus LCMAC101 TaxID=2506602 RepID=A0A481YT05_9VIRU|nr:MAG: E3 ubiquitin-protein ligase [Marseillevirus LCMAC101]
MECKIRWNRNFLVQKFTNAWVDGNKEGGYRYHRKKMLVEQAKSYTPEILTEIQREKDDLKEKEEELHKFYEELISIQQEIVEIRDDINECSSCLYGKKIFTWKEKSKERAEMNKLLYTNRSLNRDEERKLRDIAYILRPESEKTVKPDKNYHFVCPCPRSSCKGLIEKESFKCAICEKKICRRCREPKRSQRKKSDKKQKHVCNPDTIENLKLIRQDTKPCPECAVPISKIDGCGQMWCSQCKFVYNWETGKRETGNIHNPHAIRWEREHGKLERDINDIPCGGLVEMRDLRTYTLSAYPSDQIKVESIYRRTSEIHTNHLVAKDSKDICRKYLLNEIDEDQWEHSLFIRDRTNERNQIKLDVLTTLRTLMIERFRDLATYTNVNMPRRKIVAKKFKKFLLEAEEIRLFTNEALTELCSVGTKNPPQMTKYWDWSPKI